MGRKIFASPIAKFFLATALAEINFDFGANNCYYFSFLRYLRYHIDFNIWNNSNCFEETHQVLYELFFGNGFDCPTIDAVTGQVSRNAGRKVTDFDVLWVQKISAKEQKHILSFGNNKINNSRNKAVLEGGITCTSDTISSWDV